MFSKKKTAYVGVSARAHMLLKRKSGENYLL